MTGKWSQPGVPHLGWECINVDDLGAPAAICEMCEVREIRFVHHMVHPVWPDTLLCGCVCAGNMEGDYAAAKKRETRLLGEARREKRREQRRLAQLAKLGRPW